MRPPRPPHDLRPMICAQRRGRGYRALCILERAAFSAEKQDNIDGISPEARPPLPHQLHMFAAH